MMIFSAHERWLPDSRGVVKRLKTSSPTSVKSESRTHSRVGRFDEHRRENIRTLHRRVEHPHPPDVTLQMHIICIIIRSTFHAVVKAATLPRMVDETRGRGRPDYQLR